jgi:hypothetical protein
VENYLTATRAEVSALLAAPTDETYALVSFAAYLAPRRLTDVLAGAAVAEVYAWAHVIGGNSRIERISARQVPQDVIVGMLATAGRRDREHAGYLRLRRAMTGDTAAEQRLRAAYDLAARSAAAEATAYRAGCSCVYAAVVRATPPVLDRIVQRPEVRAVDPAPELRALDRAEFRPPLPRQDAAPGPLRRAAGVPFAEPAGADPGTARGSGP